MADELSELVLCLRYGVHDPADTEIREAAANAIERLREHAKVLRAVLLDIMIVHSVDLCDECRKNGHAALDWPANAGTFVERDAGGRS